MALWIRKYKAIVDGSAQPWEVERTWQDGQIKPVPRHALAGVIFGVVWLLGVGAAVSLVVLGQDEPLGYFTLVMVIPGVVILVRSLRGFLRDRRYPDIHLKPARIPVAPGDRFEVVLYSGADASRNSVSDVSFKMRVTANKWVEQSTASERTGPRKRRYVMWKTTLPVAAASGISKNGSVLIGRCAIDLPDEQEATSRLPGTVTYDWRLDVDASDSLPGFRYEFKLPVYDTRSALQRANDALGEVAAADSGGAVSGVAGSGVAGSGVAGSGKTTDQAASAAGLRVPVKKGDLDGLRIYQESVLEGRIASDGRGALRRLIRGLTPHTYLEREVDRAVAVIHVKGDRTVRRIRRLLAVACVLLAFFVPGLPTFFFFVAAIMLLIMGKAAKPAVTALHADESGLQIDEVRGKKECSRSFPWSDVGMITDTRFSTFYHDVMIPRAKIKVPTIQARIPTKREAEGIAAALASVRDRYRS